MWAGLYPCSYAETLSEITGELQRGQSLEDLFNSLILASIEEELRGDETVLYGGYGEGLLFLEDLSDEELKILEKELKY